MNSIPPHIYERVHELAVAIANATEAGDNALHNSLCAALVAFYVDQARLGQSHPFLTEAVADFTDDPATAVRYYELSLEQARAYPDEPTHTKLISVAQSLIELGRTEQAEAYLRDGRVEAIRRGDAFWIEEAERLLHELAA